MIGRIIKSTAGKPCSCAAGKICEGCKKKTIVKPQVYLEEPRRLTIPIVISHYRHKPSTTVQVVEKRQRWISKEKQVKETLLCRWYKRRKATNQLKNEHRSEKRREKQDRLEKARRNREIEDREQLRLQSATPVVDKKTTKRVKARTTSAKPRADSKYVNVKSNNRYDSLSNRFVNFCYRLCCQFYCCLSCIFIIGFVIIYFV